MTTIDPVLLRMRAAGVPPYCFRQSLKALGEGRPQVAELAKTVKAKKYADGVAGLQSYLVTGPQHVMVSATLAKELVLRGAPVQCIAANALLAEFKKQDWLPYSPETLGYWAIPGLSSSFETMHDGERQLVCDFLLAFMSRGGALILGVEGPFGEFGLPAEMTLALQVFEQIDTN